MRRSLLVLSLIAFGHVGAAAAAMVAKPVQWTDHGVTYKSFLVYDDAVAAKRPGLVMVPNWFGVNDMHRSGRTDCLRRRSGGASVSGRRYVLSSDRAPPRFGHGPIRRGRATPRYRGTSGGHGPLVSTLAAQTGPPRSKRMAAAAAHVLIGLRPLTCAELASRVDTNVSSGDEVARW